MTTATLPHLLEAPDAMIVFGTEGKINWANPAAASLFGYSAKSFADVTMDALVPERLRSVHQGHHDRYKDQPHAAFMGERPGDLVALRSDGSEFLAEISLSPVGTGKEFSVLAIVRDISLRRAKEIDDRSIRLALDSVAEAVFMFDSETFALWYTNRAAQEQIGRPSVELSSGLSFLDVSQPTGAVPLLEMLELLRSGERAVVTYDAIHHGPGVPRTEVEVLVERVDGIAFGRGSLIALARRTAERKRQQHEMAREVERRNAREAQLGLAQERERIARRLQDSVIQRLFAAGIRLQAAGSDPKRLQDAGAAAVAEIDSCIAEVRNTIFTLEDREPRRI